MFKLFQWCKINKYLHDKQDLPTIFEGSDSTKIDNFATTTRRVLKMEKRLFIETYGCQMNVADSEVIASIMKMAGYIPVGNIDEADAIFLNTCSIRENAEQKIWARLKVLNSMKRKKGSLDRDYGLYGCTSQRRVG